MVRLAKPFVQYRICLVYKLDRKEVWRTHTNVRSTELRRNLLCLRFSFPWQQRGNRDNNKQTGGILLAEMAKCRM